jgi:hypothetical protein
MAPNTGYRVNASDVATFSLPLSSDSPDGCKVAIDGYSGGWEVRCETGQKIIFGSKESAIGIRATHPRNLIELVFNGQDWKVFMAVGSLELI